MTPGACRESVCLSATVVGCDSRGRRVGVEVRGGGGGEGGLWLAVTADGVAC